MGEVYEYDTTAANNNDSPPDGWPEGMDYNQVNNCAREMMAADARDLADRNGSITSSGTAPDYTVTSNRSITALGASQDGLIMAFTAHAENSGVASTLNLNSLGAKDLQLPDGSIPIIEANGVYVVVYDQSNNRWQMLSATAPEESANPLSNVSSSRSLNSSDLDGPILDIQNAGVTLTVPNPSGADGQRYRIVNTVASSFDLQNSSGGTIYRADGGSNIGTSSTETLSADAYTLICYDGGGLLVEGVV